MAKKTIGYDEAVAELEQIVNAMESENISIDELGSKVKRATELIAFCKKKLTDTEKEVNKILDNAQEEQEDA